MAAPTAASATQPWGPALAAGASQGLDLTRVKTLVAGPVSFDPSRQRFALAAGDTIRVTDTTGALLAPWSLGKGVQDLAFAPDGSLWVLSQEGLVRAVEGVETCRATGLEVEQILGVDAAGGALLGQVQGLETGVWGAVVSVRPTCEVKSEPLAQPAPTALAWRGAERWLGTTARTSAGPTREGPPIVLVGPAPGRPTLPQLLREDEAAQRVEDLVVTVSTLAVADSGTWELWSLDGSRAMAHGKASLASAEAVPGSSLAAVGQDLVNLEDGTVTPDALPAPVVAISPDGALWVLGADEDRALWRRGP